MHANSLQHPWPISHALDRTVGRASNGTVLVQKEVTIGDSIESSSS